MEKFQVSGYSRGNIIGKIRIISPSIKNCYYIDQQKVMGDDSIATKCTIEELSSPELIYKLNSFIETAGNN